MTFKSKINKKSGQAIVIILRTCGEREKYIITPCYRKVSKDAFEKLADNLEKLATTHG